MNERWFKRSEEEQGDLLNSWKEEHKTVEPLNAGEDFQRK